jgi:hypothetical protein
LKLPRTGPLTPHARRFTFHVSLFTSLIALFTPSAHALVNPTLQPVDLFDRYETVLVLEVAAIRPDPAGVALTVRQVCKGVFAAKTVDMSPVGDAAQGAFQMLIEPGRTVVAYVGMKGRGRENNIVFYAGGEGRWQAGKVVDPGAAGAKAVWQWTADLDKELYGTFNGHPGRLAEMMQDHVQDRAFFPSVPFDQFKNDITISTFEQPVRGVALYDVDGDGRLDIYATSPAGNRLYRQTGPLQFADVTESLGLKGIRGASCSFADVTGGGRADLLADGTIYRQDADGCFARSDLLPAGTNRAVKMSGFVDLNHDGYPDVVISAVKGGLHAYLNPGSKSGVFTDATHVLGLDVAACGAGGTGFFMPGDWNNDGRVDVFYNVKSGILLQQDASGRFAPVPNLLTFDLAVPGAPDGSTGAGAFTTAWKSDRLDVVFATATGINILSNAEGKPFDAGQFGNETVVATEECLAITSEDLNADGRVDSYAISRSPDQPNTLYINRGYGSYFVTTRYKAGIFPGPAHLHGALGIAIGDVDGDGVNDILLGGANGQLTLLVNDALGLRVPKEHPTRQEKALLATSILSVRVTGPLGVLGATVTLTDTEGRVVARRDIGYNNIATGCRGPDTVNLAVREPGKYTLTVRYSDGRTRDRSVEIGGEKHMTVIVKREE